LHQQHPYLLRQYRLQAPRCPSCRLHQPAALHQELLLRLLLKEQAAASQPSLLLPAKMLRQLLLLPVSA
jgi:hypothetical protein